MIEQNYSTNLVHLTRNATQTKAFQIKLINIFAEVPFLLKKAFFTQEKVQFYKSGNWQSRSAASGPDRPIRQDGGTSAGLPIASLGLSLVASRGAICDVSGSQLSRATVCKIAFRRHGAGLYRSTQSRSMKRKSSRNYSPHRQDF